MRLSTANGIRILMMAAALAVLSWPHHLEASTSTKDVIRMCFRAIQQATVGARLSQIENEAEEIILEDTSAPLFYFSALTNSDLQALGEAHPDFQSLLDQARERDARIRFQIPLPPLLRPWRWTPRGVDENVMQGYVRQLDRSQMGWIRRSAFFLNPIDRYRWIRDNLRFRHLIRLASRNEGVVPEGARETPRFSHPSLIAARTAAGLSLTIWLGADLYIGAQEEYQTQVAQQAEMQELAQIDMQELETQVEESQATLEESQQQQANILATLGRLNALSAPPASSTTDQATEPEASETYTEAQSENTDEPSDIQ